jgi:hypothetical protein
LIKGSSLPPQASGVARQGPCHCDPPLARTGLVGGWLLAAILSFNEFTASLFVTAQRTQTLPVAMYNYVREYADPSMAALSVMYILATATLLTLANAYLGLGKLLNVETRAENRSNEPTGAMAAGSDQAAVRSCAQASASARSLPSIMPRCPSVAASS